MLKTYSLLATIIYSIVLTVLCLVKLNDVVDEVKIPYADKIFHFSSHAILTALWYITFYFKLEKSKEKAIIYAVGVSIIFGIIIEILQGTATTFRSADIYDVFANSLGALFTALIIVLKNKFGFK